MSKRGANEAASSAFVPSAEARRPTARLGVGTPAPPTSAPSPSPSPSSPSPSPSPSRGAERAGSTQHLAAGAAGADEFFLPDFCHPRMVLAVVLISELLAAVLALARPNAAAFLTDLARLSLFTQWLGLTGAALLCVFRAHLARFAVPAATAAIFALVMVNTALFSALVIWLGRNQIRLGFEPVLFPVDEWHFLLRNEAICAIATALVLRYFFVAHQWRHHVRAEARSRLDALQARIRPHFLFNSMNTIAALTRSDPARAEEAVEDLSDLFRATLRDSDRPLTIKEELELARIYQRIEALRIGARLEVEWDVASVPMQAKIPGLTIQPLLENAIYHGIERLDGKGTVTISGRVEADCVVFSVTNPVPKGAPLERQGNRLALENIRERLRLAYGARGEVEVDADGESHRVTLRFPLEV